MIVQGCQKAASHELSFDCATYLEALVDLIDQPVIPILSERRIRVVVEGLRNLHHSLPNITNAYDTAQDKVSFKKDVIDRILTPSYILTSVPIWPLVINLIGAFACLGLSSYYHTCRCVSESHFDNLLCLDKSGISLLTAGSTAPHTTYMYAFEGVWTTRNQM